MREIGYKKCNKLYNFPDLKVCPFCGKPPKMVVNPYKKNEVFFVKCMNSKCAIQPLTNEYKDIIKAADTWNKRDKNSDQTPKEATISVPCEISIEIGDSRMSYGAYVSNTASLKGLIENSYAVFSGYKEAFESHCTDAEDGRLIISFDKYFVDKLRNSWVANNDAK